MPTIGWVDTYTVVDDWADAPSDEGVLASYLQAAYHQCVEYLPQRRDESCALVPRLPEPGTDRESACRLAQVMQARAIWNSVTAGGGDQMGPDGLRVTVFPMDWTVRNLLRPRRVGRVL